MLHLIIFIGLTTTLFGEKIPVVLVKGSIKAESFIDGPTWRRTGVPVASGVDPVVGFSDAEYLLINGIRYQPVDISLIQGYQGAVPGAYLYPEVLVSGTVSLYSMPKRNHLILGKEGAFYDVSETVDGGTIWKVTNTKVLLQVLGECPEAALWETHRTQFDESVVKAMVVQYNSECGDLKYMLRSSQWSYGVNVGYRWSNYQVGGDANIPNVFLRAIILNGGMKAYQPYGGISVTLASSRDGIRPSVTSGLSFSNVHAVSEKENGDPGANYSKRLNTLDLKMNFLSLSIKPALRFPLGSVQTSVGFGLRTNWRLSTESRYYAYLYGIPPNEDLIVEFGEIDETDFSTFTAPYTLDLGMTVGRLEAAFEYSGDINEYFNAQNEKVQGLSLRLGYILYTTKKIKEFQ